MVVTMLNKVILMGRLTRDPEIRYTQQNVPVVSFTLAVDRNYRAKGETQSTADFINCVAWRNTAEFVSKWFTKGKMMVVVGSLQTRKYQDKNGENRTATEVQAEEVMFGESKRADDASGNLGGYDHQTSASPFNAAQPGAGLPQNQPYTGSMFMDITDEEDDDLPF